MQLMHERVNALTEFGSKNPESLYSSFVSWEIRVAQGLVFFSIFTYMDEEDRGDPVKGDICPFSSWPSEPGRILRP